MAFGLGHGTGESGGGYHLFFCVFFFGMVFVSFIFFLLSDLGFNSGFFLLRKGLRFFEGLVCRVVVNAWLRFETACRLASERVTGSDPGVEGCSARAGGCTIF